MMNKSESSQTSGDGLPDSEVWTDKGIVRVNNGLERQREMEQMTNDFTTYDYMEICAAEAKLSFLTDCCKCFGWRTDENVPALYQQGKIRLRLKRDRKIVNKAELTRLQRNFESCADEIEKMEKALNSRAQIAAITLGVIGTIFMAFSVFAVTAVPPHIVFTVLYAIPGLRGLDFSLFCLSESGCVAEGETGAVDRAEEG